MVVALEKPAVNGEHIFEIMKGFKIIFYNGEIKLHGCGIRKTCS